MERHDVETIDGLVAYPSRSANAADLERFVASLTIGETHFFRNHPQVDALRSVILPEIIARRAGNRAMRIWSAGCSTGEEAYSIAMTLDMLIPNRADWNITILGTDINRVALDTAREATYGEWSFRGVPDQLRRRYFAKVGRRYRLDVDIASMVRFRPLNLVDDRYPSVESGTEAMDLILCRNVLIYFRPATIDAVVERLEAALAPSGWLIAGHAESPMPVFRRLFDVHELPMAVLYRKRVGRVARSLVAEAPNPWLPVEPEEPADARQLFVLPTPPAPPAPSAPQPPIAVANASPPDVIAGAAGQFAQGDRDGALAVLHQAADADPADARPLVAAARLLAGAVQYEAAEHVIRMALARDAVCAPAHYVHALILEGLGRVGEAYEALRRTAYLDPTYVLAYFSLASLLDTMGQSARARKSLDRVVELLDTADDEHVIDEHEGLTAGRLRELTAIRRQLLHTEVRA